MNQAAKALGVFLADPRVAGLEITEFDPTKDPGSVHARNFSAMLVSILW